MTSKKSGRKTSTKKVANSMGKATRPAGSSKPKVNVKVKAGRQECEVVGQQDGAFDAVAPDQIAGALLDSRLPPVGTTLVKRDRRGAVRCECTIEADGIRYAGALYGSLSAAASAAAKDLGLKAAVNGFSFFQIIKANRPAMSPSDRLRRIGERYEERAREYLATMTTETDEALHAELEKHVTIVRQLFEKHAA